MASAWRWAERDAREEDPSCDPSTRCVFHRAIHRAIGCVVQATDTETESWALVYSGVTTDTIGAVVRSPGYLRWGRFEGCDFVTGSPVTWPSSYTCSAPEGATAASCTPDNRMSARCNVVEWGDGAGQSAAAGQFSCVGNDACMTNKAAPQVHAPDKIQEALLLQSALQHARCLSFGTELRFQRAL